MKGAVVNNFFLEENLNKSFAPFSVADIQKRYFSICINPSGLITISELPFLAPATRIRDKALIQIFLDSLPSSRLFF